jgi:hypothetical protein
VGASPADLDLICFDAAANPLKVWASSAACSHRRAMLFKRRPERDRRLQPGPSRERTTAALPTRFENPIDGLAPGIYSTFDGLLVGGAWIIHREVSLLG